MYTLGKDGNCNLRLSGSHMGRFLAIKCVNGLPSPNSLTESSIISNPCSGVKTDANWPFITRFVG